MAAAQLGNNIGSGGAVEMGWDSGERMCIYQNFLSGFVKQYVETVDIGQCSNDVCEFTLYVACDFRGFMNADGCAGAGQKGWPFRGTVQLDENRGISSVQYQ